MKTMIILLTMTFCHLVLAQVQGKNLKAYSEEINRTLPVVYDRITKLKTTTVENNDLSYHFLIDVTEKEFEETVPKVKGQVLGSICSRSQERIVFQQYKANIIYRYENVKGQSLGEFMVRPDHCSKK